MTENPLARPVTPGVLLKFAVPNMIMMVFLSLYTIVDGMFIARLCGEVALSSANMYYPLNSVELATGIMLGTGGSAVIAKKMGEGKHAEAREEFTLLSTVALLVGIAFSAVCIPNLDAIFAVLGVSDLQYGFSSEYARTLLWFSPLLLLQLFYQFLFITAGKPHLGLALTITGGVSNMVLDWLFMGPMNLGIGGASVATGIGYAVTAVFGLFYFTLNRRGTLYYTRFSLKLRFLGKVCTNGSSEMCSNLSIGVTTFLFNLIFLELWGESGVAAIAILSYSQFVFSSVFLGFSMGIAPVVSYQYGAGEEAELRKLFRFSLLFVLLCSLAVFLTARLSIAACLSVFTAPGSEVYRIALEGFPIYSLQFLFMGTSLFASAFFTALGNGSVSAAISFSRTFLFLVAGLLLLPALFGKIGVWCAVPAAEVLGIFVSVFFLLRMRNRYHYC